MSWSKRIRLHAAVMPQLGWDDIQIWGVQHEIIDGTPHPAKIMKVTWEACPEPICPPCLAISLDQAQELLESLWGCGIRPKNIGTLGQLAALENHLKDLRSIAFKQLKIESK